MGSQPDQTEDVPVVFIGLAHWHVPMHVAAARRAGLSIVGGWDPDRSLAAHRGLHAFETRNDALSAGARLAVVTGTPLEMPDRLLEVARTGTPALVEKPVARDAASLRPLVAEIARAGAWVAVALPHHCGPLASAAVGAPHHLSVRLVNGRPARYREWGVSWVLDPSIGGGGALRNLGVHGLDLARMLLGPGLAVTAASIRHWHGEAVEDHAVVHLCAPDGATATVEAGYLHPDDAGSDFEARLVGQQAMVIDTGDSLVRFDHHGRSSTAITPQSGRYDDLMAAVAARLRAGRPPPASLADLLGAMDLVDSAYERAGTEARMP